MLDYEKLDVYRTALEFVITTIEIRDRLPRGSGELVDQFKRASFSIVLNIAEGAGKFQQADKQRYFSIARGSVMECGALRDVHVYEHVHVEIASSPTHLISRRAQKGSETAALLPECLLRFRNAVTERESSK